jgi:hypothetical protein
MTEEGVKLATCKVVGKDEFGTGWLVARDRVLTAYHCVAAAHEVGDSVVVRFGLGSSSLEQTAAVGPHDKELDVCVLVLATPLEIEPVPISVEALRPGEEWFAFGHPVTKLDLGHVVKGQVQQVLTECVHGVDLDLSVEPGAHLSDYKGLSGSALMIGLVCKGLIRLSVDSAIGAVSLHMLQPFLEGSGLLEDRTIASTDGDTIGPRPAFDELFESTIVKLGGGYVFIDGSHGIGKSTYCREFRPESKAIERLGVYHFSEHLRGIAPAHQAQPEVFFDWANSLLSTQATGRPARLMDLPYSQLITRTGKVFEALAQRLREAGKQGLIFIDGINEALAAGEDSLKKFVNLLPESVPNGLVVVIAGVGLDLIATSLGPKLHGAERLTLPVLDDPVQHDVCIDLLDSDKAKPSIVAALCERAKGHPLYLRYLTDLVNRGASQTDIDALPVFSGKIEDYYETIWAGLVGSPDAVHLLALFARLRWGIPVGYLTSLVSSTEAAALPSTLARIRHLLDDPETTSIYHSSFSDFIVHKTVAVDQWTHMRLAAFCLAGESGDYGVLNRVHHALRAPDAKKLDGIRACHQRWVDDSVLLGAEPDILLADIDDALNAATESGTATEIIRLLLLSQRLIFRYNVLFVQSAELVARALISIGKTDGALRHVVRNGRLVLSADEACAVANTLTRRGSNEEALNVLELFQRELSTGFFEKLGPGVSVSIEQFLNAAKLRLHGFALAHAAGAHAPFKKFLRAVVEGFLPHTDLTKEQRIDVVRELTGDMIGARLSLEGAYQPLGKMGLPADVDPRHQLMILLQTLEHAQSHSKHYAVTLPRAALDLLLQDVASVVDVPLEPTDRRLDLVDSLIESGARPDLVATYAAGMDLSDASLPLYEDNRAVPDSLGFESAMQRIRAAFFLHSEYDEPAVSPPDVLGWEDWLKDIARAVAWCDGKGRQAVATRDAAAAARVWSFLVDKLLPSLKFDLKSRAYWDSSYLIPEAVTPLLYRRLTKLALDCYPMSVEALLDAVDRGFDSQLGLYNEGFRRSLHGALSLVVDSKPNGSLADKAFALTLRWRDYVSANIENRFELVPELLQIVPLLADLEAAEEALTTYRMVLAFSMGPSWYKENQLSIMTSTLEAFPATSTVPAASLAEVAGLLERASGEMTFQRFVRADKGSFIGELGRRSLYTGAIRYFQHQSCGTIEELYSQATSGDLDRVSALVGMRFPGAALEEQTALLALLRQTRESADWRVRWALLEVFLHGDERHLPDWGREFAVALSQLSERPEALAQARARVRSTITSLNDERAWLLLVALVPRVPTAIRAEFEATLDEVEARLDADQLSQLTSSFDVTREVAVRSVASRGPAKHESPTDDSAEKDMDEDAFFLPGTFGKRSALTEANTLLESARRQVARRNFSAAVQDCIAALKALQDGGWSIWSGNHSHREAEQIIGANVQGADQLARMYGPLVLDERYNQRWTVANHIISLVGKRLDAAGQAELLRVAIDHVRQLVGTAPSGPFARIGASAPGTATDALVELLLWAVDHPSWERRDSAAAMVLWCARSDAGWLPMLARLAVSMDSRARADIAAATLDILSRERPAELWKLLEPHIPPANVLADCRHVGRLATVMRIVERASTHGIESALKAVEALQRHFPEGPATLTIGSGAEPPEFLPYTLRPLWRDLDKLGVLTEPALERFVATMRTLCAPYGIESVFQLESLVAEGAREGRELATGRWASLVRYALNVSLFQPMPSTQLKRVELILRAYNPESLMDPENGRSLLASLVACLSTRNQRTYLPSYEDLVFLDVQCFLEIDRKLVHVELTSHLTPPGPSQSRRPAQYAFRATEVPHPGPEEPLAVCGRARPTVAYFGAITPAIPTPRFLQLLKANASATVRYHWRDGATSASPESSRRFESAVLAVKRDALKLPDGWRIHWILRVNGDVRAVLNSY